MAAIRRIHEAALAVNEKPGVPEWRAGAWLLNNHPATRRTYYEHRSQQFDVQTRHVNEEHRAVAEMSQAEVIELLQTDWLEMLEPSSAT